MRCSSGENRLRDESRQPSKNSEGDHGFEGIRSERLLIATVSLKFAHRWRLGYLLDEDLPNPSSLTRIRQRLGVEIFQCFFERIVDLCQGAGLVLGLELFFEGTKR